MICHVYVNFCEQMFKNEKGFFTHPFYKFMNGGGGLNLPPSPILFVKTIEKVIRLCTVLIFFYSGSFISTHNR